MLTTLDQIKSRLGFEEADVQDDALLTHFITLVSARFEAECNRQFRYAQNVQDQFCADETELRVACYPIDEAAPITFERMASAAEGWLTAADVEFLVRHGCVISLAAALGSSSELLRVTYSGGFVLPGAGPVAETNNPPLPEDLARAALEQAVYWYQNKDRLGLASVTAPTGSFRHVGDLDLLPAVRATLGKYERWMV